MTNSNYSILSNVSLFTQTPQLGNFAIIQDMVTASTPLATVYNGQQGLGQFINDIMNQANQTGQSVTFGQINEIYQFNLYKVIKPKIIYSRYTSRVLPDGSNMTQLNTNGYFPSVQFKIDYDACCVGQMTLLFTTDIRANDFQSENSQPLIINGYAANGVNQISVGYNDIQSVQIAYNNDFVYHYIDKISLGFCNTGGGNTIWHQEVPSEIAKIYHSIIECPGMSTTIRRMIREDVFTLQHSPYHQYGEYSFAIKSDNQLGSLQQITSQSPLTYTNYAVNSAFTKGFNEIAMYWVNQKVKEISMSNFNQSINAANPQNYSVGYQPQITNVQYVNTNNDGVTTAQYLAGFDITYISQLTFGSKQSVYTLITPTAINNNVQLPSASGTNLPIDSLCQILELSDIQQLTQSDYSAYSQTPLQAVSSNVVDSSIYVSKQISVSDKLGQTITPSMVSSTQQAYTLSQSSMSAVPIQVISKDLWQTPKGKEAYFQKIQALAQQRFYPEFTVNYTLVGSSSQKSVYVDYIIVPFIVISTTTGQYQLCTQIIMQKQDSSFVSFAQYQLSIQETTTNNSNVESLINFRQGKLLYTQGTLSDTTYTWTLYGQNLPTNSTTTIDLFTANTYLIPVYVSSLSLDTQYYSTLGKITCYQNQKYFDTQTETQAYYQIITLTQEIQVQSSIQSNDNALLYVQVSGTTSTPTVQFQPQIVENYTQVYQTLVQATSNDFISTASNEGKDFYWNAPLFYQFTGYSSISAFIEKLETEIQSLLFQEQGAVSPYLNTGSLNYINLEIEKYDENDYALNGLAWYYTVSQSSSYNLKQPNPTQLQQKFDIYRYNAALLNNHQNEEFSPSIYNVDYQSIHTFRKYHGVVDFYFPLDFLFICQGVRNSFPHYACSAQSIIVKFDFINPISLINTCVAVNPTAIDQLDFSRDCRLFVNRVNNFTLLQNNTANMGFVLFYNRYQWIPEVLDIITDYQYYAWVTKNYNRERKYISVQNAGSYYELAKYTRSVFYNKIWCFVVGQDTLQVIDNQGGFTNIVPIEVNKFNLPLWDILTYDFQQTNAGNNISGDVLATYNKLYNSVYSYVPFDAVKIETDSSIQMTDDLPFRFQMFNDYTTLDWTQQHSPLLFNNLLQFNLDPVYYQEDAPNAVYSPAYAPYFKIVYKPKTNQNQVDKYGVIMIAECINISYIQNHIMLCKYQTNN